MSGICAFYCHDQRSDAQGNLEQLLGLVGNSSEVIVNGSIGLGAFDSHERDLGGMLYSDDSVSVVSCAELYDTPHGSGFGREAELIAKLYKEKGTQWMDGVHGVWSAALHDRKNNTLHCWTDRIGTQPLHWATASDGVAVCTRIAPLRKLRGVDTDRNKQALYLYFEMEMIPTPHTVYKGIQKLESGHILTASEHRFSINNYWEMRYPVDAGNNEEELCERIRTITMTQLKKQLDYGAGISTVGSFLSGGTDSSLIAGLSQQLYPNQVNTFSMGFNETGYDEMEYARIAARKFQTNHHEYYVTEKDVLEALPRIVASQDEPYGNSSIIPTYVCARMARQDGLSTLLGGDGGDEVFGGNIRYHQHFAHFKRYPGWVPAALKPIFSILPTTINRGLIKKAENYVKRAEAPLSELIHAFGIHYLFEDREIFHGDFLEDSPFQSASHVSQGYLQRSATDDLLHQFLYHDLKITLMDNDLRKVGNASELAGMRIRYPYLDYELVEFSGRFSSDLKVRDGVLRYLFKKAFADVLPIEILAKKKQGFGLPIVPWMLRSGELNELLRDTLFDGRLARRSIFNDAFVNALYTKAKKAPNRSYGSYLYNIFFMELWFRQHIDEN